jgi:predicted Zn-dependent peptidase
MEGRLLLQTENAGALSEFLGQQLLLTGTIMSPAEVIEQIRAVTAAEVQAVAARLLDRGGWRLAAVGPGSGQEDLAEAAEMALGA